MPDRPLEPTAVPMSAAPHGSVFLTGQVCSREQRRGRYTPESMAHPGKMLPSIARLLIRTYTQIGDWVCDPMAGIATTVVEAMHLGRHGIGVEYEARWATLAADNLRLATSQHATGTGQIVQGDARRLPALVPAELHGRIAVVITSPPYGPSTHGHARTPGPRRGKVCKINHTYGGTDNLAYRDPDHLAAGFAQILTGAAAILRPGGIVAVTARPYRRHGELIDIPGMVAAAGLNAGLLLHDEGEALIAGVRDGRLIPRASFFQQKNARAAIAAGEPQWLLQHEDVVIFAAPGTATRPNHIRRARQTATMTATSHPASASPRSTPAAATVDGRLDPFTSVRMDRCPQPARPAITGPSGCATEPAPRPGREPERTTDPCPPQPRTTPASARPDDAGGPFDRRRAAGPPTGWSDPAGHR